MFGFIRSYLICTKLIFLSLNKMFVFLPGCHLIAYYMLWVSLSSSMDAILSQLRNLKFIYNKSHFCNYCTISTQLYYVCKEQFAVS